MPKNVLEKEHYGTFKISKLLSENQLQMEHFAIKDGSNRFYQLLRPE
jgi:hypothetical protein